jgi:hypothetical protein
MSETNSWKEPWTRIITNTDFVEGSTVSKMEVSRSYEKEPLKPEPEVIPPLESKSVHGNDESKRFKFFRTALGNLIKSEK